MDGSVNKYRLKFSLCVDLAGCVHPPAPDVRQVVGHPLPHPGLLLPARLFPPLCGGPGPGAEIKYNF
jgi:hypothetical protein